MRTSTLLSIAAVITAAMLVLGALLWPRDDDPSPYLLEVNDASLFISDAGTAIGGFEFTAGYNVSFISDDIPTIRVGEKVKLKFTLDIGLGDPIGDNDKDELSVKVLFDPAENHIGFEGKGFLITMLYFENDTVWNHTWDGYYIASWGGYAPTGELRGEISPEIFDLPEHYYVELRMDITVHCLELED